jgi:hypothetical protein
VGSQQAAVRIGGILNNKLAALVEDFHLKSLALELVGYHARDGYAFEYKAAGLQNSGYAIDDEHSNLCLSSHPLELASLKKVSAGVKCRKASPAKGRVDRNSRAAENQ